jgi:hypothetical protein
VHAKSLGALAAPARSLKTLSHFLGEIAAGVSAVGSIAPVAANRSQLGAQDPDFANDLLDLSPSSIDGGSVEAVRDWNAPFFYIRSPSSIDGGSVEARERIDWSGRLRLLSVVDRRRLR